MHPNASIQVADCKAFLHVFSIPELARLICELVSRHDTASLLCVCRQMFQNLVSFAWERIDSVEALVRIIPGTYLDERASQRSRLILYKTMHLPKSLDLSRFNIYSPYVKRLDIPLMTRINKYENWDEFLVLAQSIDLLPNLEHLKLAVPQSFSPAEAIPEEYLNWIIAFLSPSLLSLQIHPDLAWEADPRSPTYAWVSLKHTSKLLQALSEKCHRLNSLTIMAGDINTRVRLGDTRPMVSSGRRVTGVTFHPSLLGLDSPFPRFNCLRKLSVTPFALEPDVFQVLSKLPCLQWLSIRDLRIPFEQRNHCPAFDLDLTEGAFPALEHLDLLDLIYDSVINICKRGPLGRALSSVRPAAISSDCNENKLARLLYTLKENNSPVTRLSLPDIPQTWAIPSQSLNHLAYLNLIHLSLPYPDPDGSNYDLSRLLRAVPALRSLEFSEQDTHNPLQLVQLRKIATLLPNLSRLAVQIDFHSATDLKEQDLVPLSSQLLSPFVLDSNFRNPINSPRPDQLAALDTHLGIVAKYLLALWPNITCRDRNHLGLGDSAVTRVNALLFQLRGQSHGL